MIGANRPKYIPTAGREDFRQPAVGKHAQFYYFILKGDSDHIQENLCNRYLNAPTNGKTNFRPATDHVILCFTRITALSAEDEPDSQIGYVEELSAALYVITYEPEGILPTNLRWFSPYTFVDNGVSLISGRENYGFHKTLGWFTIPDDGVPPNLFTADTLAFKKYSPSEKGARAQLLEVRHQDSSSDARASSLWSKLEETFDAVPLLPYFNHGTKNTSLWRDVLNIGIHLLHLDPPMPMVFLKQLRDVSDGTLASYQAIVEATTGVTGFNGGGLLHGDYEVNIAQFQSHPILDDFGFAGPAMKPEFSFWMNFDFIIPNGTELWRA